MFWYGSMGRFRSAGFILDKSSSEEDFIRSLTSSWSRSDVKILKRQQPLPRGWTRTGGGSTNKQWRGPSVASSSAMCCTDLSPETWSDNTPQPYTLPVLPTSLLCQLEQGPKP